jgi:2-oxo-3-(phosphooxy)propyl 3-oxoalkanoate synthase
MLFDMSDVLFQRTVDRALVHRAAVAEVFITDMRHTGGGNYLAGAQLPLDHHFYSDHTRRPARFDPLLIGEAGRQAAMYGAHQFLQVPPSMSYAVHSFSVQLRDDDGLLVGISPGELRVFTNYSVSRRRAGLVRGFRVEEEFRLAGYRIGTCGMSVSVLSADEYRDVRFLQRRSPAPSTADIALPAATPVAPDRVGRVRAAGVVLADAHEGDREVLATLRPDLTNSALFDHAYDHFPAMVLLEGARQAARLAARDAWLSGVSARFLRFAELDEPVRVQAVRAERDRVTVRFTQAAELIAEAVCTVEPES